MTNKSKITTLDALRGFAVLSVAFGHFAKPLIDSTVLPNLFRALHTFGNIGVQVFFVISGFIIPYSLYKSQYTISDYFRFLYKRILRLHPPYLFALIITFVVAGASYKLRHLPNPESLSTIILSVFYLHVPVDNPVFWTLGIEAQFYIFMGLFFILMINISKTFFLLIISLLLFLSQTFISGYIGLFSYIIFFLIGTLGFLIYSQKENKIFHLITLFLLIIFSFIFYKFAAALTSFLTILVILFIRRNVHTVFEFPGKISYSLYLIHFVLGIKLTNLLQRFILPDYQWVLFIITIFTCFFISWVFWKFIEKPSAKLSNEVKYGNKKTKALVIN
jgi:peptidoglycan/LPS O-acetylase OafA/YrhL